MTDQPDRLSVDHRDDPGEHPGEEDGREGECQWTDRDRKQQDGAARQDAGNRDRSADIADAVGEGTPARRGDEADGREQRDQDADGAEVETR
ncbi:MAG: hypothetical protein E6K80_11145 [Candidatus Eisenbacteria bacterium]|uniref:Uncharacterized protein n=1 Tax=Eiseniibacteriota bacterium TaxID=2212470 RepID=A0A538U1D1_UNCEI|nr:MAG: hypothetical protein E6K80_11145 [Candidatus Eisenbacteria bacterium]